MFSSFWFEILSIGKSVTAHECLENRLILVLSSTVEPKKVNQSSKVRVKSLTPFDLFQLLSGIKAGFKNQNSRLLQSRRLEEFVDNPSWKRGPIIVSRRY